MQPAVEDQADLVGAADVEVVADDLFEEHPARDRFVEHLGQRELGLQDRQVVAVAGGPIGGGERVRQDGQPLTQQRVDLAGPELVADRLHRRRVVDSGEPVVQGGEPDPRLRGLAFGPLVAVEAQLGVVGEVGAELQEERAEVGVHAVEVEVVDQPGGLARSTGRNRRWRRGVSRCGTAAVFSCARPMNTTPSAAVKCSSCSCITSSLRCPLTKSTQGTRLTLAKRCTAAHERVGDLRQRCGRGDRQPQLPLDVTDQPSRELQLRNVDVQIHPVDALDLELHMLGKDIGRQIALRS